MVYNQAIDIGDLNILLMNLDVDRNCFSMPQGSSQGFEITKIEQQLLGEEETVTKARDILRIFATWAMVKCLDMSK